jgi:DNA adenine methylase
MRTEPFLRWAGGKRWLAPRLAPLLKSRLKGAYFEPFLGAGAIFFELRPRNAILSDLNDELINAFWWVRSNPEAIIRRLARMPVEEKVYYQVREAQPSRDLHRAVRFIYLNRTCYGGLHRTNRQGHFNVPYGGGDRTPEPLWRDGILAAASSELARQGVAIVPGDFERYLNLAEQGDVVYCDPVYSTKTRGAFDRYNASLFAWSEQERLSRAAYRALERGALVLISNARCPQVAAQYRDAFRIQLDRSKSIGNSPADEAKRHEYLIVLDPADNRRYWKDLGTIERRTRSRTT